MLFAFNNFRNNTFQKLFHHVLFAFNNNNSRVAFQKLFHLAQMKINKNLLI